MRRKESLKLKNIVNEAIMSWIQKLLNILISYKLSRFSGTLIKEANKIVASCSVVEKVVFPRWRKKLALITSRKSVRKPLRTAFWQQKISREFSKSDEIHEISKNICVTRLLSLISTWSMLENATKIWSMIRVFSKPRYKRGTLKTWIHSTSKHRNNFWCQSVLWKQINFRWSI